MQRCCWNSIKKVKDMEILIPYDDQPLYTALIIPYNVYMEYKHVFVETFKSLLNLCLYDDEARLS